MSNQAIPFPLVRNLVEIFYDFQSQRIMTNSRIQMNSQRNGITEQQLKDFGVLDIMKSAEQFEKDVKKQLEIQIKQYDIYTKYLSKIQGVGPIISAGLIAYIGDINRFDNISKLWQLAGFGMNSYCKKCKHFTYTEIEFQNRAGKKTKAKRLKAMPQCNKCRRKTTPMIQRRTVGYMSNWNDNFKVLCWKVGQSIQKQKASKSGYRKLYDEIKKKEREKNPVKIVVGGKTMFNDGHINNRTLRKVIKIFLANLWITWRLQEGLPVSNPYIIQKNNAHNMVKPFVDKT